MHSYFVGVANDPDIPLEYHVERVRDGRSYSVRSCRVFHAGTLVFVCFSSFSVPSNNTRLHTPVTPKVTPPDALVSTTELWRAASENSSLAPGLRELAALHFVADRMKAVEMRPLLHQRVSTESFTTLPQQAVWFRAASPGVPPDLDLGSDGSCDWDAKRAASDSSIRLDCSVEAHNLHLAVLAYASDFMLLGTAVLPWGFPNHDVAMMASLDHSLWFHALIRTDDYILIDMQARGIPLIVFPDAVMMTL